MAEFMQSRNDFLIPYLAPDVAISRVNAYPQQVLVLGQRQPHPYYNSPVHARPHYGTVLRTPPEAYPLSLDGSQQPHQVTTLPKELNQSLNCVRQSGLVESRLQQISPSPTPPQRYSRDPVPWSSPRSDPKQPSRLLIPSGGYNNSQSYTLHVVGSLNVSQLPSLERDDRPLENYSPQLSQTQIPPRGLDPSHSYSQKSTQVIDPNLLFQEGLRQTSGMPPLQPALSLAQPAARSLRLRLTEAEKDTTTKHLGVKSAKAETNTATKRHRARLTEAEKNQKHNESEAKRRQTIQQIVRGQIGPHLGMINPKDCRNEGNVWKAYREHALQLLEMREELIGELKAVGVDVEKDLGIFVSPGEAPEPNKALSFADR